MGFWRGIFAGLPIDFVTASLAGTVVGFLITAVYVLKWW